MNNVEINILLIEDNEADSELTRRIMKKEFQHPYQLMVLPSGAEAVDYLQRVGKYQYSKQPHLILLDLNLPMVDGWEVLKKVKSDPKLNHIPIIILTTSKTKRDIEQAYQLHCNSYIVKPLDLDRFSKIIKVIENYWFNTVELPPTH